MWKSERLAARGAVAGEVLAGPARAGRQRKGIVGRLALVLATALVMTAGTIATAGSAAAQVPPTVPCEGCGPGAPGAGTGAYSYTEFTCEPPPRFLIFAGVNVSTSEPVTFTATYGDVDAVGGPIGPVTSVVLGTLQPGQHVPSSALSWDVPHEPGVPQHVQISGVGVTTGRVYVDFDKVIDCECPDTATPTTASVTPTSPATMPGGATPGATTPMTSTRTGGPSTAVVLPGTLEPSNGVLELPATGNGATGAMVGWGATLLALGLVALVLLARRGPAPASKVGTPSS